MCQYTESGSISIKKEPRKALDLNGGNDEACLGFPPRSESFAYEPSVQVSSISSLSGLATLLRRPSANPFERKIHSHPETRQNK